MSYATSMCCGFVSLSLSAPHYILIRILINMAQDSGISSWCRNEKTRENGDTASVKLDGQWRSEERASWIISAGEFQCQVIRCFHWCSWCVCCLASPLGGSCSSCCFTLLVIEDYLLENNVGQPMIDRSA